MNREDINFDYDNMEPLPIEYALSYIGFWKHRYHSDKGWFWELCFYKYNLN